MLKLKSKKFIFGILLCICAALFALPSIVVSQKVYAYNPKQLPTGSNAIGNLVSSIDDKGNVKFDKANLNALAIKGGYDKFEKMVKAAEGGAIKTSADFGTTVVNFGSYEFNGITRELTWIPAYLSQADREGSDKKDAVLTLWLAGTETEATNEEKGIVSNQEISMWSDGTYSISATGISYHGNTIYTNTYDGSYIRNYMLNGSTDYLKDMEKGDAATPPDQSTMTKFSSFVGDGALAGYIVEPKNVNWQKTENRMKNDPAWEGTGAGIKGTKENYTSEWTGDKLWLHSQFSLP